MAKIPSRYIVFDTETSEHLITKDPKHVSLHFRLAVAKLVEGAHTPDYKVTYYNLRTPECLFELLDSLPKQKEKIWIFAHNIGFDLRIVGLFDHLASGRYSLLNPNHNPNRQTPDTPFVVLDDPPTIIRTYREDGQELLWVDTWQWLSSPLAKIGQILGNSKGVMPSLSASDSEWYPYCKQDVDVLDDAMMRIFEWIRINGYQSFHPTRAGQSRLIYSQIYEKKRILYHNDPWLQAVERPSYYGGFTECFRLGAIPGPIYQVDANSLYPYVMSKYWYPCEVVHSSLDGSDTTEELRGHPKSSIAEVYLDSPINTYPLRCKEGTVFVRGKVRTYLPGPELEAAFRAGDVSHTTKYVRYRMEPLFVDFVKDMYEFRIKAKAQGNEIFDYFYKLVMNSLYGKFGQLTGEWVYFGETDPSSVYAQGWTVGEDPTHPVETRILAGTQYRRQEQTDHEKSFVAIASFVTSYAREYMRSIRNSMPSNSVYYQATDSLYLSQEAYHRLEWMGRMDPLKLGAFKLEETYDHLHINNIHNLDKGEKKVRGSIKSKAVEIAPDTFRQEQWENLLPGIKSGHTSEVHIREIIKRMTHRYDRMEVTEGGHCVPYSIDNWGVSPEDQRDSWLFRKND